MRKSIGELQIFLPTTELNLRTKKAPAVASAFPILYLNQIFLFYPYTNP